MRGTIVVAAGALVLALTGCSTSMVNELLGGPQGDEDRITANELNVIGDSTRLLYESDELTVWAARSADPHGGLCLVLGEGTGPEGVMSACGSSVNGPITAGTQRHNVYLVSVDTDRPPADAPPNVERVAQYLWVAER